MPDLQNVGLSSCTVDWSSPIFNGLTELALFGISRGTRGIVHGLILTLGRLPGLRRLELKDLFWKRRDIFTAGDIQNVDKVALLKLKSLTLPDTAFWVTFLLAHLELPKSATIYLTCVYADEQDLSCFHPFTANKFSMGPGHPQFPAPHQPLRSLDILRCRSWNCESRWQVACSTSNLVGDIAFSRLDPRFALYFELETDWDEIIAFFHILPMENLDTIVMFGDYRVSHKCLWTEAFGNAPELRVIRQKYIGANRLIHALQHPTMVLYLHLL